ncbi:Panacea domain-containing protein [Ahrensia sp. R2A130]|uniref:Panacea domain-containing protein n=1 Tax=Ahrensia sp. R2A130 TaxID=744979 RepID=UPI0001E08BEE|nr:Panacea domain-containing protein [Ahrensia sp. R2A130]EFL89950.1 hypothetical protein R2A130_0012 [Ahrensia sp. R2A130]
MKFPPSQNRHLTVDQDTLREALLYVMQSLMKLKGEKPSQYEIVKSLFIADRVHLLEYGRPITFDNYVAMKDGPVGSFAYDLLKPERSALRVNTFGSDDLYEIIDAGSYNLFQPTRKSDLSYFSETDIESMEQAVTFVAENGFNGVWEHTHALPEYETAWNSRGSTAAPEMNMSIALPNKRKSQTATIAELSKNLSDM